MNNQCVPCNSWDIDENPRLDYEVAELRWENGQLSMHGLGNKQLATPSPSPANKYNTWDKPPGGTLESIVNQATIFPHYKSAHEVGYAAPVLSSTSAAVTVDALVPCSNISPSMKVVDLGFGTGGVGCSTRVDSCSGATAFVKGRAAHEWSSCMDQSVTGSATFDSRQLTLDTCEEREFDAGGFTTTSMRSPGNTSSVHQFNADDHDSVCHSRPQKEASHEEGKKKGNGKSSLSTRRSRTAAIHNQSEQKRRHKINQRMKTLQKLVPNSSKTDKASMLDEVIEYMKQLQAQVQTMSRMNMMLPLAMQQLQMSMMGMGFMDMSAIGHPNFTGILPILHPAAFMPLTSWEGTRDRFHTPVSVMPEPMSAFLACQSQPMTMEAYSRMATLYQQLHQNYVSGSKN